MRKLFVIILTIFILAGCKSPPPSVVEETVIEVIDPEFEVVSILILQADLVVTEFETVLRIKNPNEFPVELKSMTYELHGNGIFWADGKGADILHIEPFGTQEAKFTFKMNFINMNRRLLDDIIAMRQVRYRFKGEAEVQPVIAQRSVPRSFIISYDCSGLSEVKPK
ncbi:MAG: LEA type 2 family protein [Treponema sp.]|nr:LEA type 2 family protein [Treponema sp.]